MSGLFGAHKATTHATRAMGIDFQGAQYGPVVPVVYGQNKVPGNCIWYGDFQSHAQQQKAGKGGGGGSTTNYTYSASAQMGLCEGQNVILVTVYDGTSVVNLSSIDYAFASGNIGQAAWSHLSGSYALGYSLTAIFSFQNLDLGSQASLPNYNYEVKALKPYSASIPDANPSDILSDICSDPYHGVNFPFLGSLTQYSNYCIANSLFLSPVYDQQQSANQALSDLFKYTNTHVYYSEDQLKVVPLGDVAVTGNGVTFTPNVTPVVNLGTDDFLADGAGATITIDRKSPQDNLNLVRVEFKDRSNTYHDSAVVAANDEDIITNGGRSDDSETVNGCTSAAVARFIAQNLVQRAFYVRNTYQFKLSWRYCYLEPTDIVTLTDASLGLSEFPVRITEIEEDGDSALTITAEEFPEGIGHSAIYDTQPNGGTNIDQNADPGAVNPPYLFRGPGFLVGNNTPEIWCAVNGSGSLWAGCEVYLSHDGTSYTFAGTVASQARYGSLTTALAAGTADPDITNTPTVQAYAPAQLLGGSQTDADNFVTLAMVDTEIIAYETATLQAANTYQLGYLRRGGYGSANVAHAIGAPFVRLDDSIFRMPVDPSLIGSTVYLKFLSINAFGRTPRTLADETAYTYVVGTNVELPDVPDVPASFAVLPVADGVSITWSNDNPAAVGSSSIEYATASGGPWNVLAQEGPTTTSFHHAFTTGATYYYRARARGPLPQSGWSAYTSTVSSTGKTVQNGATVGAINGPGGNISGAVDGGGYTLINFGSAGHLNKNIDNIGDGADYYRMPGSNMDVNRRALVDFSQGGHLYKHLGNISDDPTSARYAVYSIDGNRRAIVDFGQGGHLNKNVDNVADGATYARPRAVVLQSGIPLGNSVGGINLCPNPSFESNLIGAPIPSSYLTGAPLCDDWQTGEINGFAVGVQQVSSRTRSGSNSLQVSLKNGINVANGGVLFSGAWTVKNFPCVQGDTFYIGAYMFHDISVGEPAGVSISALVQLRFYNAAGSYVSQSGTALTNGGGGSFTTPVAGTVTAPAGATSYKVYCQGILRNQSGAAITTNSLWANLWWDDVFVYNTGQALTIPGSNAQLGDQRQMPALNCAGPVSRWQNLNISYTGAAGSPATATINVSAAQVLGLLANGGTVSYNASSASVSGTGGTQATYYLYYSDPTFAGGSATLHVTTNNLAPYQALGNVYIGSVVVSFPSSGSGGGSGGGGLCVGAEMWISEGSRAGACTGGELFDCIDLPTAAGKHQRALQGIEHYTGPRIRLITDKGAAWIGGLDTPFDLPDDREVLATRMLGERVVTDWGIERVVSAALIGDGPLCRNHLGGVSYAAGADPHHRVYSHNGSISKP